MYSISEQVFITFLPSRKERLTISPQNTDLKQPFREMKHSLYSEARKSRGRLKPPSHSGKASPEQLQVSALSTTEGGP